MLAKRKRKNKSFGANLKYEVYGILLITISVIALSGEATVGRSLSSLFALALGKFYFVLALVGIYIGLSVMVKRAWPQGWSYRKSGIVLLVLAFTLMSAISEIGLKLGPQGNLTSGAILTQLGEDIRSELFDNSGDGRPVMSKAISGGYAGAIQYSILFMLFGEIGTKFMLIVMFAIAVMLITGKSYVDLFMTVRRRAANLYKLLKLKFAATARPGAVANRSSAGPKTSAVKQNDDVPLMVLDDDEEMDFDYDEPQPKREKKKKSLFFSWLHTTEVEAANDRNAQEWEEENGQPFESPLEPPDRSDELRHDISTSPIADMDDLPWEEPEEQAQVPAMEGQQWPDSLVEFPPAGSIEDEKDSNFEQMELPIDSNLRDVAGTSATPVSSAAEGVGVSRPYKLPSLSLLSKPSAGRGGPTDTTESKRKLEATLESFGVRANVLDVVRGPAVTRYEVQPASGVKVSRIVGLTDDIALALAAKDVRMEAPIPGKSAIGIEVPNTEVSVVMMREVMETTTFQHASSKLSIAFGRDISGQPIVGDLARMPHLLVAGATGSGKSVCINGIITSILYKAVPDEVRFLMIDPKMVELNVYNGIPHLLAPVVTDPRRASLALKKIVVEMEKRYELFSKSGTRNIEGYNTLMADNPAAVLPYIVVIVDELADLMMVAAGDVEDAITRLAQMARAAGIHLIIATQRPSVDVITGVIKANIPSRIAFGVSSQVDSRTILDMAGAEKLLGRGDMLFLPVGMSKPIRVQGAFLSDQEVEAIVNYVRGQGDAEYNEELVPEIDESADEIDDDLDVLYDQAVQIVLEAKQASVSLLQRRMRIGYTRAARLIDQMEARSIVGPYEGSKPREVLLSIEQYQANKISS
ncbi:DNA translocase FtsK [Paenibacillus tarimensis]